MALKIPGKVFHEFPFTVFEGPSLDLERGRKLEWLLTNGLGGYSSSTILGLNTRKYHGLLVSSGEDLSRFIYLQGLREEVRYGDSAADLGCCEFVDDVVSEGWRYLTKFEFGYDSVSFHFNTKPAKVVKRLSCLHGWNALLVSYEVENKLMEPVEFRVNLLVNSRGIHDLSRAGSIDFETNLLGEGVLGVKSGDGYLTVYSDRMLCRKGPMDWVRGVVYSMDRVRGDDFVEDVFSPAFFTVNLEPGAMGEFSLVAVGYGDEAKTADAVRGLQDGFAGRGRLLSSGVGSSILELLTNAEGFVVERGLKKSVVAGYHWFGEWGRDAMISLPGLCLINRKFDDAELVFEHFLNNACSKGIPSRFVDGKPVYCDFDSSLWLIDRLYQYMKYVGRERAGSFLHTYWWTLKDIVNGFMELQRDGLLFHKSGTWMDTLERSNAVEVQALWYNALRIMEVFSTIMKDRDFCVRSVCEDFEANFLERFWNGRYLNDCLGDESLRPNQVIALSLDYGVVNDVFSKKILDVVERELLTPFGLRTLSPRDSRYRGRYVGDFSEREKSYHNGTVWPWLLGPYIRSYMRVYDRRLHMQKLLEGLFEKHVRVAGVGLISEVFDGDAPHTPRGCISQAWSVAELLRAYFEDVMSKKPPRLV